MNSEALENLYAMVEENDAQLEIDIKRWRRKEMSNEAFEDSLGYNRAIMAHVMSDLAELIDQGNKES